MSVIQVMEKFPDQASCIRFLEVLRWRDGYCCPHCGGTYVRRKTKGNRYWNCHDCKPTFNVTSGTMFHGTKIPLKKWFLAIALVSDAKKSISSYQLARDLSMNQKFAWYMLQRIRLEMKNKENFILRGIIEADETYIGGRPRKRKDSDGNYPKSKPGRGTKKSPVIGAVERGGRVVAKFSRSITGKALKNFLLEKIDVDNSVLMTDQFPGYNAMDYHISRGVVNHSERYVNEDGFTHTNTIEGFWACVKRAWYGTHHHYSEKYLPLYVAESCYKYNNRWCKDLFIKFLDGCFA